MWDAIRWVSSGFTLAAFAIAAWAWLYRHQILNRERLIRSAPEGERPKLILQTIETYHFDTSKLTGERLFQLVLAQLKDRARARRDVIVVVVIIAFLLKGVSVFAPTRPSPPVAMPNKVTEPGIEQNVAPDGEGKQPIISIEFKVYVLGDSQPSHFRSELAARLFAEACDLHARGLYPAAIDKYKQSVEVAADVAVVHINLGAAYYLIDRFEEAIAEYRTAITLAQDDATAHFNLGIALLKTEQTRDAARECGEAVRLLPDDAAMRARYGVILALAGDVNQGLTQCQRAVELGPEMCVTHSSFAEVTYRKGDFRASVESFRRALDICPQDARVRQNLAVALIHAGRLRDAATELREVIRQDPTDPDAHFVLGYVYEQNNELPQAIASYRESARCSQTTRDTKALLNVGVLYLRDGTAHLSEAEEVLLETLRRNPGSIDAKYRLGIEPIP